MDEYIAARNRIPRVSNTVWLIAVMSLSAASRAVSLASRGSNGGSFGRKFIIPSPA
jgi:hypothetical protein